MLQHAAGGQIPEPGPREREPGERPDKRTSERSVGPAHTNRECPMRTSCMIETHGLCRTFRTRQGPIEAVAGIDLGVETAAIFGFLGPNGAGKTTTLRMLSTLLPPSGGEATVAGCDLLKRPHHVRERIGYVGQQGAPTTRSEDAPS